MSCNQGTIKNVLFGSSRQSTNILEIVKFVHISLEEIGKLIDNTENSLRSHHQTLTRVRQVLKILQKRQRIPGFVSDFLGETRISIVHVERLTEKMRKTKRFLKQLLECTMGPLGDQIMLDPRKNQRRERVSKQIKTSKAKSEEYVEDSDCKIEKDDECKISDCL